MKKFILPCLLCVFFLIVATNVGVVYACQDEQIKFSYNGRIFTYSLQDNIKTSNIFSIDHEINKYNRFGSQNERINLLNKMLSIGIEKSVALDYIFPNLNNKINSIAKCIYVKPSNAKLNINSNSENVFQITKEVVGIELNKQQLFENVCLAYLNKSNLEFEIPIKNNYPQITQTDLQKHTNLRADFSTNISTSSPERKHNIKNALNSLNKVEILPNQIFSFNKTVGRRTAENGYLEAKIIVNNEFVDGLGGGVCQVSSTLYNSALLAGLEIVEANKHSKQVGYVNYGFDAMVNFGSSDLKFRNNTNEKLTIITNYSSSTARIRIFGEHMHGTKYKLFNEVFNITEPVDDVLIDEKQEHTDKVFYDDEFFYLKKGNRGMEIKSYREKYINNQLVSTELLRHDKFKVNNAVKVVGKEKRNNDLIHNLFTFTPTKKHD